MSFTCTSPAGDLSHGWSCRFFELNSGAVMISVSLPLNVYSQHNGRWRRLSFNRLTRCGRDQDASGRGGGRHGPSGRSFEFQVTSPLVFLRDTQCFQSIGRRLDKLFIDGQVASAVPDGSTFSFPSGILLYFPLEITFTTPTRRFHFPEDYVIHPGVAVSISTRLIVAPVAGEFRYRKPNCICVLLRE